MLEKESCAFCINRVPVYPLAGCFRRSHSARISPAHYCLPLKAVVHVSMHTHSWAGGEPVWNTALNQGTKQQQPEQLSCESAGRTRKRINNNTNPSFEIKVNYCVLSWTRHVMFQRKLFMLASIVPVYQKAVCISWLLCRISQAINS